MIPLLKSANPGNNGVITEINFLPGEMFARNTRGDL